MTLPDLTPDCRNCDALCCVLLAFDAGSAFALNKPACVACHHLTDDNLCRIHAVLADQGFTGCLAFDCHGAGQRVTQQVFKGRSWRDDPSLLPALDQAFRLQRRLHEALVLLISSAKLPLTEAQQAARQSLLATLAAPRDEAALQGLEPLAALAQTALFLTSLRAVTAPRR